MTELKTPSSGIRMMLQVWYERINASIYHRINIAMVSLTLFLLLLGGALSFGFMRYLVTQNIRQTLESDAVQAAFRLQRTMNTTNEALLNISRNLIISNALVDTVGRDAYIVPFMKSFKLENDIHVELTLCDFMGKPLASNVRNPQVFNSPALLHKTIEEGKGFAELMKNGKEIHLLIALPVIWVMTNKPEGVLIAEVRLEDLFAETMPATVDRSVALLSHDMVLLQKNKRDEASFFELKKPLHLSPPLDALAFQFEIEDYRKIQVGWLVGIYGAVVLLFIALTLWVSKKISHVLTNRLLILSDAAKRIAESGSLEVATEVKGTDEVTALAAAFNAMVGKVREARDTLELRVEERTEELYRANEELNTEISERKQAEDLILRSLKEKEVMLKEIHHRVKNNMQVIHSLLSLQAKTSTDKTVRALFEESQNRIQSMSLIHEKLYRSKDMARIDFKDYLQSLVQGIAGTFKRHDVRLSVDMESFEIDVNTGIPCGLIINELVSNSLKHAFPEGRTGTITLGIRKDSLGNNVLTVADNGIGFPESIDFRNTTSLGLQLVNVLTGQIHGTVELVRNGGTTFRITFPGK